MRAVGFASGAVFVFALAGAGCDWRTFDDLKKTTPVAAIGAPSGYAASDDFGPILLPLAPPADGSAAGRFVATAVSRTSVGVMSLDAAGHASGYAVAGTALDLLEQGPVTALALVPGGRQALLGAPAPTLGDVLVMNLDAPPYSTTMFRGTSNEAQYGVGVGAGSLGGGIAPDFVVLSADILHVYMDGLPTIDKTYSSSGATDPCPIDFSALLEESERANRAVIVAQLLASGMQIAVGTPVNSGVGHVSLFEYDAVGDAITCAGTLTATEALFGQAMTLVDLVPDPDHKPDHLLIGAPPTHAYLYSLPLTVGAAPVVTVPAPMPGARFGAAVAAFDIDGVPGDEVFIGSPEATVNGAMKAGQVNIYTGATLAPLAPTFPNPLAEHDPGTDHGYGSGIAGMTFCPGAVSSPDGGAPAADGGVAACTTLPLVGSRSRVFAYFTLKKPDPRVK